jgi:hypothetical protein
MTTTAINQFLPELTLNEKNNKDNPIETNNDNNRVSKLALGFVQLFEMIS